MKNKLVFTSIISIYESDDFRLGGQSHTSSFRRDNSRRSRETKTSFNYRGCWNLTPFFIIQG